MIKVRLEFLSWLADAIGLASTTENAVLEPSLPDGKTVRDLFNWLADKYPRFRQVVFDAKAQQLTEQVIIFYNGRLLETVSGLDTKLNDGDILILVPPIEGG